MEGADESTVPQFDFIAYKVIFIRLILKPFVCSITLHVSEMQCDQMARLVFFGQFSH